MFLLHGNFGFPILRIHRWCDWMTRRRNQVLSEKAAEERRRCRDWLLRYMRADQPQIMTKDELRSVAMRELDVSKLSFDLGWIMAIEDCGRHNGSDLAKAQ